MSLVQLVHDRIIGNVVLPIKAGEWMAMIVDHQSLRILSSCIRLSDITSQGIAIIEDINKIRERLSKLEGVYFVFPSENTVNKIIQDFETPETAKYKAAHLFFTEACPEELFQSLSHSAASKYIKTLKEIYISFLPYDSLTFTLGCAESFSNFYGVGVQQLIKAKSMLACAEQIATLCATIADCPVVRFWSQGDLCEEFACAVQKKLIEYKSDNRLPPEADNRQGSQLIIIDRCFDPVTPLVHELTYQAMVYDLLPINNDIYKYQTDGLGGSQEKEHILNENDEIWKELRHSHIATVSKELPARLKSFLTYRQLSKDRTKATANNLADVVKQMPQYQRELKLFAVNLDLAKGCMKAYMDRVKQLCRVEQDLVMGTQANGEEVTDLLRLITPTLTESSATPLDKLRLVILYMIHKQGGITEEALSRLMQHAQIPSEHKTTISNMALLGVPPAVETPVTGLRRMSRMSFSSSGRRLSRTKALLAMGASSRSRYTDYLTKQRPKRLEEKHEFDASRWVPYLKDLLENAVEDKLDPDAFPLITGADAPVGGAHAASVRFQQASSRPGSPPPHHYQPHSSSSPSSCVKRRLIIFIIGGMTMSEMRCAYEVAATCSRAWDVYIGSTHILTPEQYLQQVKDIPISKSKKLSISDSGKRRSIFQGLSSSF